MRKRPGVHEGRLRNFHEPVEGCGGPLAFMLAAKEDAQKCANARCISWLREECHVRSMASDV